MGRILIKRAQLESLRFYEREEKAVLFKMEASMLKMNTEHNNNELIKLKSFGLRKVGGGN